MLCNPVDKNGEGISDATAHLVCYSIKDVAKPKQPKFVARSVQADNQFGSLQLKATKSSSLCVPSEKNGVASNLDIDHFKCYAATDSQHRSGRRNMSLSDQFEAKNTTVVEEAGHVVQPGGRERRDIKNPANHLVCYGIKDVAKPKRTKFAPVTVTIDNQFGPLKLKATKAVQLCVPSKKTLLP